MSIALIVPVMKNFEGFANLMMSVDVPIKPVIIPNWERNIGVSAGWNEGLRRSVFCDAAIIVNDDVKLFPETIDRLVKHLDEFDLVSAFGGYTTDESVHETLGGDSPDYACFAVKPAEFLSKFGFFDENFTPAYFEDNDMRYRIKTAGGRQGIVLNARMEHMGSVTQNFDGDKVVTSPMFEKNREYYKRKWGGVPGSETLSTPFGDLDRSIKDWTPIA